MSNFNFQNPYNIILVVHLPNVMELSHPLLTLKIVSMILASSSWTIWTLQVRSYFFFKVFSNFFLETKCESFHDYASDCRDQGVVVDWREDSEVNFQVFWQKNKTTLLILYNQLSLKISLTFVQHGWLKLSLFIRTEFKSLKLKSYSFDRTYRSKTFKVKLWLPFW